MVPRLYTVHRNAGVTAGSLLTILTLMLWPCLAQAQVDVAQDATAETKAAVALFNRAVKRTVFEASTIEPLGESTQPSAQHQLTVVADKGDINGRARFYQPIGSTDLIVTFTGPLSGGNATLATAHGLGKQVTVNGGIKLTTAFGAKPTGANQVSAVNALIEHSATTSTKSCPSDDPSHPEADARRIASALCKFELLRQIAADPTQPARTAAAIESTQAARIAAASEHNQEAKDAPQLRVLSRMLLSQRLAASPERTYAAVAQLNPELVKKWTATFTPGFEVQHQSVGYLVNPSLDSATFDRTTRMVTLSAGVSHLDGNAKPLYYAGMSFKGGTAIDVGDSRNICRALSGTAGTECLDAPLGAPTSASQESLTVEWRQWLHRQALGLNPRYSYVRTKPDEAAAGAVHTVDIPIYFMRQVTDIDTPDVALGADLIGGVNVGWRSGPQKGAFLSLFISKAFGLP